MMPLTCTMGSSLETLRFEVDNIPMLVSLGLWTEIDNLDHSSNNAPDPLYIDFPTDHGQATSKLNHLRLRVECTLFVIYKVGRETTPYWW